MGRWDTPMNEILSEPIHETVALKSYYLSLTWGNVQPLAESKKNSLGAPQLPRWLNF